MIISKKIASLLFISTFLVSAVVSLATPALAVSDVETIPAKDIERLQSLTNSLQRNRPAPATIIVPPPPMGAHQAPLSVTGTRNQPPSALDPADLKIAKERADLMEDIAKKNPEVFLRNVMPDSVRKKLSPAAQAVTEKRTTLTGTMRVLHADDFDNPENSSFEYSVRVGKKDFNFYPVGNMQALTSGTIVKIDGFHVGETVVAAGGVGGTEVLLRPLPRATGPQSTLFILVTATGKPATPYPSQMSSVIFSGNFNKFYKEQSYGKAWFVGDVTDWITIPAYSSNERACHVVDFETPNIKSYLINNRIDLARYTRIVFVGNDMDGGCASVGKRPTLFNGVDYELSVGWVGYPVTQWDKEYMSGFEYVLSHEMGHELGVMHANAWRCEGASFDVNCRHAEYGNAYDIMGHGGVSAHFNAFYKDLLEWVYPWEKVVIDRSGSYTLAPLEAQTGVRVGIIRNPYIPSAPPLYIEYRQPIGFDRYLATPSHGLMLNHVVKRSEGDFPAPRLIRPGSAYDTYPVVTLRQSFQWPSLGLGVTAYNFTPQSAGFSVNLLPPVCNQYDVEIGTRYNKGVEVVPIGSYWSIEAKITNHDTVSCAPRKFMIVPQIVPYPGAIFSFYPLESFTLLPGESTFAQVAFQITENVPTGEFRFTFGIRDQYNKIVSMYKTLRFVRPPRLEKLVPATALPGDTVTVYGSGFSSSDTVTINGRLGGNDASIERFTSSSQISFVVPRIMLADPGDSPGPVPTPPGSYYVSLFTKDNIFADYALELSVVAPTVANITAGLVTIPATVIAGTSVTFSSTTTPAPTPVLRGYLDSISTTTTGHNVVGWACFLNTTAPVTVDIAFGGTAWRSVVANRPSEAGVSTACGTPGIGHRFLAPIDAVSLTTYQGMPITATVQRTPLMKPVTLTVPLPVSAPTNILPRGYFDSASCTRLNGWTFDPTASSTSIGVVVKEGETIRLTGTANLIRSDVNTTIGITGNHGFSILTPASLKDGITHTLRVYGVDTDGTSLGELFSNPRTVTCAATTTNQTATVIEALRNFFSWIRNFFW